MMVSIPGDAGGLGALEDALLLLLPLVLVLGCSRDPTHALSTADSPLLRVALLLSATGSLACTMRPPPQCPAACQGLDQSDAFSHHRRHS